MNSWRLCVVELLTILCIAGLAAFALYLMQKDAGEIVSTAVGGLLGFLTRGILETAPRDSLTDSERGSGHGVDK